MLNEIARSAYPSLFWGFPEPGRQSMVVPEARTTLPQRSVSLRT
jgi:hypothetical protein